MYSSKINVCIVDDDKNFLCFIRDFLSTRSRNISISSEYHSAKMFLNDINDIIADVVLLDIGFDQINDETGEYYNGIDLGKIIKQIYPDMKIILLTGNVTSNNIAEAKILGADFIEKGSAGEEIIDKIITLKGNQKKSDRIISFKTDNEKEIDIVSFNKKLEEIKEKVELLSPKQRQILNIRKQGKTIKEISEELKMNPKTVETHLLRALKKLQLPSLLEFLDI